MAKKRKRNPNDATLRNIRAAKKRIKLLERKLRKIEAFLKKLRFK